MVEDPGLGRPAAAPPSGAVRASRILRPPESWRRRVARDALRGSLGPAAPGRRPGGGGREWLLALAPRPVGCGGNRRLRAYLALE